MWRNYLTVAWRFLVADRAFTFVNLLGLAIGLASVMLLSLHVAGALASDRWLPDHERLYRIDTLETTPGREPVDIARAPGPLRDAMMRSFPDVEDIARAYPVDGSVIRNDRPISERLLAADSNFLRLIRLPLITGSRDKALASTGSIVLSERAALRHFGRSNVVGERLTLAVPARRDFIVSAVFETLPKTSHMHFNIIIPSEAYFKTADEETAGIPDNWGGAYFFTYARLRPQADLAAIDRALPALVDRSLPQWLTGLLAIPPHQFYRFRFVPVADIPFDGGAVAGFKPKQSRTGLFVLAGIAALILLIACVNFVNLTTARSTLRIREVALRKVVGAKRRQIFAQFMGEAILLTGIAGLIGVSLVELALPYVEALLEVESLAAPQGSWRFWVWAALATLATAVAAGLYPAAVLSRVSPAALFQRGSGRGPTGRLRELMVTAQFAIAITLIAVTSVMLLQMRHTQSVDLHFDRENMVIVRLPGGAAFEAAALSFKQEMARTPGIVRAALSSAVPSDQSEDNLSIDLPGQAKPLQLGFHRIDRDFFATYGVRLLSGEGAAAAPDAAEAPVLLNQAAAKKLGFATVDAALGQAIRSSAKTFRVVGVVPDLHFRSLHQAVRDEMFILDEAPGRVLSLRLNSNNPALSLRRIDDVWKRYFPDREIDRAFLDESIEALYKSERAHARLIGTFAGIAILLSCLGLLAMAAFSTRRRAREIAIRKVLGARTGDVFKVLVWAFARPVLLANIVAWPVAWWAMRNWLNGFEDRVTLGLGPFALASGLAMAIALGTIAFHAMKVARANPIHALRYE